MTQSDKAPGYRGYGRNALKKGKIPYRNSDKLNFVASEVASQLSPCRASKLPAKGLSSVADYNPVYLRSKYDPLRQRD